MTHSFEGKKVLVTGASRGIGEAIARLLHRRGACVGLSGSKAATLEPLAATLGERAFVFPASLDEPAGPTQLMDTVLKAWGGIDVLINNAAITCDQLMLRMSDAQWDSVMQVNLRAVFQLCRASLKPMLKQRYGRIVNLSSIVAFTGNAGQANYVAAKAGLVGFSKALAQEVASRNVTVNVVAPGFIATAMTDVLDEVQKQKILEKIPLGRIGSVDDIAQGVAFLAGEEAHYITGQTLHINGGMAMA